MSKRSLKATGFTRFFLMLIIVAPIAYIAASFYNGQDGIQNIKGFLGIVKKPEAVDTSRAKEETNGQHATYEAKSEDIRMLKETLDSKTRLIYQLMKENIELKRKLESLEKTVEESQNN